jgi:DNA-binding NarL/FixJ family response regulator/two-component sensor histidine kinase
LNMTDRKLPDEHAAAELARFARELHDGAVRSLIAVEMQVDVLRRQAEANRPIGAELGRIQSFLREEVLKLRELMQQMKAIDVDAQTLLAVLRDTVERFQRETGINARFVTDLDELDMPQRVCRELLRIVQEGLVNVTKHRGARYALVRLASAGENWSLTVEDDGKGFSFEGRYNQQQMEEAGKWPRIITERVRLITGELTVESNPGHGMRLEIIVPRNPPGTPEGKVLVEEGDRLTENQREVLRLLAEGKSVKEIASVLNLTPRTVAFHKYSIMEALHVHTNAELVRYAIKAHSVSDTEARQKNLGLTPRELKIVSAVSAGYPDKEIAESLKISEDTVKHHLSNIFDKLGVSSRLELTLYWLDKKRGGPEGGDGGPEGGDAAGIAVIKPRRPNLNRGSSAAKPPGWPQA